MKHFKDEAQLKRVFRLFLCCVFCYGIVEGFSLNIFSNFFKDAYNVSDQVRGWIETPRESPGVFCMFYLPALAAFADVRLARYAVIVDAVAMLLKVVIGLLYVIHRQARPVPDGIGVARHPAVNGHVPIIGSVEIIVRSHIVCNTSNLRSHMLAMDRVPYIGIVADASVGSLPVFLPSRDNVEDISSLTAGIVETSKPHGGVAIIRSLRHKTVLPLWLTSQQTSHQRNECHH